jgi:hypothetical protein
LATLLTRPANSVIRTHSSSRHIHPVLALLSSAVLAGCGSHGAPPPPAAPVEAVAPMAAAPPRPSPPPEICDCPTGVCRCPTLCVVERGELRQVPILYNSQTGDTLTIDRLPFSSVYPLTGEYAAVAGWYVNDEPISFRGRRYRQYGRPRVLWIMEVERVGVYRGVGVYAEAADTASAREVIYLPYRPGCEFQPYAVPAVADRDPQPTSDR